jgi:hypothetical protein
MFVTTTFLKDEMCSINVSFYAASSNLVATESEFFFFALSYFHAKLHSYSVCRATLTGNIEKQHLYLNFKGS